MRLNGKIAVITGAGSGIGRATATRFAAEGACLVIGDRNAERLEEVAGVIRSAGGTVVSTAGDISRKEVAESLIELAIENHGRIDVLVNNAGIMDHFQGVGELSDEIWRRVFATNVDAPMYTSRRTVPHMIQQGGGSIVNTASIAALVACNSAEYAASKAGVLALTRVAAQEYGPFNIRVNAICPGATATPMARRFAAANPAGSAASDPKRLERMGVLGRFAVPEEMAKAALFLASDDASYATGATFVIDGGWTIMALEGGAHYTPEP